MASFSQIQVEFVTHLGAAFLVYRSAAEGSQDVPNAEKHIELFVIFSSGFWSL